MRKIKPWILGGLIAIIIPILVAIIDGLMIYTNTEFGGILSFFVGYPWIICYTWTLNKMNISDIPWFYFAPLISLVIYFIIGALIGFGLSRVNKKILKIILICIGAILILIAIFYLMGEIRHYFWLKSQI